MSRAAEMLLDSQGDAGHILQKRKVENIEDAITLLTLALFQEQEKLNAPPKTTYQSVTGPHA